MLSANIILYIYYMKKCSKCKLEKNKRCFNTRGTNTKNLQSYCKKCAKEVRSNRYFSNKIIESKNQRIRNIFKKYGVTENDYVRMFNKQNGKCAICNSVEIKRKGAKHFNIDHCHKTKIVRGLLCHNCNIVLGKINDSRDWLKNALLYLST